MTSIIDTELGDTRESTIGIIGIDSALTKALKREDLEPETEALVKSCINDLDSDRNGRVDRDELVGFAISLTKQVQKLRKKNYSLMFWGKIVLASAVLLMISTFAASTAAVFMAKDMQIENDALVTTKNQSVKTITNEVEATVGALAFLPAEVRQHVKSISFKGGDNVVAYDKQVASIVIHPKKSAILTTTEGDTLAWSIEDNKNSIKITLADGESWLMSSGCEKCTIINIKENNEVLDALDEYHEAIKMVLHEHGRVLHEIGCVHIHAAPTIATCMLPTAYKGYFDIAVREIGIRVQNEITALLDGTAVAQNALGLVQTYLPDLSIDKIFNFADMINPLFNDMTQFLEDAETDMIDIATSLNSNLESVGGTVAIVMNCRTDIIPDPENPEVTLGTEWVMDLKVTGEAPSISQTLLAAGVGSKIGILEDPFPEVDLEYAPTLTVGYELNLPVKLSLHTQTITLMPTTGKLFTKVEQVLSTSVNKSEFVSGWSGAYDLNGGFVMESLLTFELKARSGTVTLSGNTPTVTLTGATNHLPTLTGKYLAGLNLPVVLLGEEERIIPLRAIKSNMFDTAMPCVTFDTETPCEGYERSYWDWNKDMCFWKSTFSSAMINTFSFIPAASATGACVTDLVLPSQ